MFSNNNSIWNNRNNVKIFSEYVKGNDIPQTPYNLDGLIFTPISIPYPNVGGRWEYLLKWKPPILNSIDFLVRIVKDGNKDKISYYNNGSKTFNYKSLNLYVGKTFEDRRTKKISYGPSPFVISIDGSEPTAQVANVQIDSMEKMYANDPLSNMREEIQDETIVEFSYIADENRIFRWQPIRVRHDKTEKYKKTKSIGYTANDIKTALNVWDSMNNPVNENVITEKEPKPVISQYYKDRTRKDREESSIAGLREFHNKFVKKQLLVGFLPDDGLNKDLLDLSSGQGGDMWRWAEARGPNTKNMYNSVLGIDISKNNIYSVNGGALDRLVNFKEMSKGKKIPDITFVWGNSSNNLLNGSIAANETEKEKLYNYFSRNIVGGVPGNVFDMISLQFSIHYFFSDKSKFYGLMNNIVENIKEPDQYGNNGGLLLITTLDGDYVDSKLSELKFGDEISKNDEGGNKMWAIKKLYKQYNANKPRGSKFGYRISAYVESIGQYIDEYLVSPKYLRTIMEKAGLIQVKSMSFEEMYNEFKSTPNSQNKYPKAFNMSANEKEYSFMHRMWVFRKTKKSTEDFSKLATFESAFDIGNETSPQVSEIPSSVNIEKTDDNVPSVEIKPKPKVVKRIVRKVKTVKKDTQDSVSANSAKVEESATATPTTTIKVEESAPATSTTTTKVEESAPATSTTTTKVEESAPATSTTTTKVEESAPATSATPAKPRVVRRIVKKVSSKKNDTDVPAFSGLKK